MRRSLAVLGLLFVLLIANGQTTFIVDQVPPNTPDTAQLFMGAGLNQWAAADSNYLFSRNSKGHYTLTIETEKTPFEFKLTRGTWESVETDDYGHFIDNRVYDGKEDTVFLQIKTWDDFPLTPPFGWAEITISDLPNNTPPDARIFAVGSFNAWHTDDENYRLEKLENGTLEVSIPLMQDTTLYKFTRGSWETAEGQKNGRARANRQFILGEYENKEVELKIESWEDLAGSPFTFYTIILLAASIQGILLILAINSLRDNNLAANRILSILLLILSLALAARISTYDREIFNRLPILLLIPDFIYFLYAPVFLIYMNKLLRMPGEEKLTISWLHFIPFVVQFAFYLPLAFMEKQAFISRVVDLSLKPFFVWNGGIALIYNVVYWIICRKTIEQYERESGESYAFESNLEFLKVVMWLKLSCLTIWGISYLLGGIDLFVAQDLEEITDRTTDILWLAFSFTAFFLGYYTMRQPEIFKLPAVVAPPSEEGIVEKEKAESMEHSEISLLKAKLEITMEKEKLYLNPGLSLSELAGILEVSSHSLSRVINEGYGVNFNDFVNAYRIQEFKRLVRENIHPNHTFLAIALMVGFNSKSAFNRSFKKLENQTPREFAKQL